MSYNEDVQKTDELGKEDCILEPEVIVTVKEETKDGDGVITMHNDNTSESNKNFEFVVVKDEPEDVMTGGEEDGLEDIEILERKSFHKGHKTDMGTTAQQKEKSYGKHVSVVKEKKAVAASKISAGSKQNQMHFVGAQAGPSTSVIGKSVLNNIRQRGNQIVYGTGLKRTIGKFICKHCGNIFETFLDFEVHVKSHISEKPFTCPCGRSYMHKGHLKEHMLTHTDKKPHTCSECSKSFAHKGDLTIHMRIHTGEKPYSCTECGKCFVQGGQLKMHMRTHTGEKPYSCSVCGKSFVQKHNMLDHMFLHTGEKPYSCNQCGRSFVQGCHLKDHMKTHSGEKPYSCTFCGKSFLQNSDLRVHVRGHTGEKPFSCSNCGKSFARSGVLKRHMLTHTGEKPYKCEECGKQYTQSSKLKRHMGIQHNKSIISPEVVSKSVISPEVVIIPSISCNDGVQQKDVYDGSIISNLSGRDLGPLSKDSICKQYTQSSKLKRHMGNQHNKSIISPEVVSKSVISPEVVIIPSISCNEGVQQNDVYDGSIISNLSGTDLGPLSKDSSLPH